MPDNGLSSTAVNLNWSLVTVEALVVSALLVAAILMWDRAQIWNRICVIEAQLQKIEKVVYIFTAQESRRFILELNAKSSVKTVPCDAAVEIDACDVAEAAISPITAAQLEDGKSAKLTDRRRPFSCRKSIPRK